MNKKIILVTGYKRSGKDTFSRILKEKTKGEIFKLAEPLRAMVKDFIGIDDQILEEEKETKPFQSKYTGKDINYANRDMSIRDLMILFSEGLKQYYGQDIFCEAIVAEMKKSSVKYCIVSDVRYPYEVDYIKSKFSNVVTVRIRRKGIELSSNHSSETNIDLINEDVLIKNDGSILDLEKEIDKLLKENKI